MVNSTYGEASKAIARLLPGGVTAYSAYRDVELPGDHDTWTVCFQGPAAGARLLPAQDRPELHLVAPGTACPGSRNATLHPTPTAAPTPARQADPSDNRPRDNHPRDNHPTDDHPTDDRPTDDRPTDNDTSGSHSGSQGGGGGTTVRGGSFCSPQGATGVTVKGTPMVCGPGSDGRNRWHAG
ncbi:hypothetical protein [Streptomyces cinnamoneus]|uniref:hypothetical protein n=1 Tax=Streptomyces cinnamoneus TaxID=53446 RepID=UPI00167CB5EE|nr:hypothetical protein [Streptomyces cinnamoneus]